MAEGAKVCTVSVPWHGPCKRPLPCEVHAERKCVVCGAPVRRQCSDYASFGLVCGKDLYADCPCPFPGHGR